MLGASVGMEILYQLRYPQASRRHHRLETFTKLTNDSDQTGLLWLTPWSFPLNLLRPLQKLGGASNPAYSSLGDLADGNSFGEPCPNSPF